MTLQVAPQVPAAAVESIRGRLSSLGYAPELRTGGDLILATASSASAVLVYEQIMTPVDRFSTILQGTTMSELRGAWSGSQGTPNFEYIYVPQELVPSLELVLGPAGPTVRTVASDVAAEVWRDNLGMGILPFDKLTLRVRALEVDGKSVLDNRLDAAKWPLAARTWVSAGTARGEAALTALRTAGATSNRDPRRLTVVATTGVTAITRGAAVATENAKDFAFLARVVGPELAAADFTTTSNETSYIRGCVPDNRRGTWTFCSKPEYFAALALSGIDLVGLTGNHLSDFGAETIIPTLELYRKEKVLTYGGGEDDAAAKRPVVVEHNGNRIGFIGANQFGPPGSWATDDTPGAARFDRTQLAADIAALRRRADVVFADIQHTETDAAGNYQMEPLPEQQVDFRAISDAGAQVVTGVQAHTPQAIELRDGRLVMYGLGNLYFDQTWSWETSVGIVARYAIYGGKLLNTELLVTVIDADMQTRWATPAERAKVLKAVFAASGW